ncbi:invasin domain 3-containing protein [Rhodohalobacter sp.]|uniref:invasin domain 3-containing protein n=1 Tax=Rhodohalobacter sp. TaxID=1974210 RepID=UPI002ACE57FA|nr:invasin domain 3-containing protein [Rhodohalobacter sp.]MDZ7757115.1 invasin domain 3-containing protein [Rhodohalobacter sp.]
MKKLNYCKFLGFLLLFCGFFYGNGLSQSITISIPDELVDAGDVITIPVSVNEITADDAVLSGEWRFTTSSDLINFQSVSTEGTILDGINSTFNNTSGNFAFASTESVTGSGTILNLTVQVRENAVKFEEAVINITDGRFNEGEPQLNSESGVVSVRGIELTPKKPSGALIEGQTFQFSVEGNITEPVTWSSSDTGIATVSTDGLVEGITPGTVKIFVEDAAGLADSTDFFRVEPISLQELTLGVSDQTVTQTLTDTVQVLVSDLTGLNITSGQFDLSFTSSKLEILSISTEGTILEGRQAPTVFEDGSQMSIAFADAEPYEGEGALFNIIFRVNRDATGTASFIPQNVLFNEAYEAETYDGTVTIEDAPEIVINQPENELTIGEGQTYTVVSGGTAPYTWQSDDESIAVINENTGELEALSRGTVNITATDSEGFESEPVLLKVNDVTISLPDTNVSDNNIFSLPVQTTDLTGLGVVAYEIDLDFDDSLLNFESVESAGSISEGLNITSSVEEGVLKIAAAGTSELSGAGDLLYVNFSIPNTVEIGSSGIVNPLRVQFNEPGENTPTATRRSGIITYESSGDPDPVVDADLSSVTATSPHLADGEDPSFVTVTLIDTDGNPIEGFDLTNLAVQVTGSAEATAPDGLSNPGEYGFTVTNATAETVTVTVTADGVELTDQPEIVFEPVEEPVDADLSSVSATSPHVADGEDQSTVVVQLADSQGDPITRFTPGDLLIQVSGSAEYTGADNTGNPGEYAFAVTNTVAETVTVSITVDDVLLTDQPEIVFQEPEEPVDADLSSVSATSPHVADGEDQSTVVVQLADSQGDPITRFTPGDLLIQVSGSAEYTGADNTGNPGEYAFAVTNTVAETVTVSITVDDVLLTDQPEIVFEPVDEPGPVVDADLSSVTATSPHLADGEDPSFVTVTLIDTDGNPIEGFDLTNLAVQVTGSAEATAPDGLSNPGEYGFAVRNSTAETVTVTVTADGVELTDQPEIVFEEPLEPVDAELSSVSATTPHLADGEDQSTVVVQLADSQGDPITRFTPGDLLIQVSGSAENTGADNTGNPGEYAFAVTNTVAETVTVSITVDDVLLTDQPEIVFEPVDEPGPVVDADLSSVSATSPHLADGEDPSFVTVTLIDTDGNPIEGFDLADLAVQVTGNAVPTAPDGLSNPGEYGFTVTNSTAETVTVTVTADGVELTDQPEIVFEPVEEPVDAEISSVSATTPHLADGEDQSTVVVQLADSQGDPITRFTPGDLLIQVSGSAEYTGADNTGNPGEYAFAVTNTVAETVTVSITVDDVLLTDQPEIVFEPVEIGIPSVPVLTSVTAVEGNAVINWSVASTDFIDGFFLYRGDSVENLAVIDELNSGIRSYSDQNPLEGTAVYAIAAVNSNGEQSALSNTLLFVNSEVVASTEWQLVSIPLLEETSEMELATIYSFSDRYDLNTFFEPGKGYWVKTKTFDEERLPASGPGLDSLSIQLNAGWNLIGSLSIPAPVSAISDPDEILTETPVYLYRDSNYQVTNEIVPNFGHWIYARESGSVTITVKNTPPVAGMELADSKMQSYDSSTIDSEMAKIEFRHGDYSAEIFASQSYLSENEQLRFLLPPVSPDPKLDVRVNNRSSLINSEPSQLQITTKQYPIEIKLEGPDENSDYAYRLHAEKEGKSRTIDLIPGNTEILDQEYESIEIEMIHADEAVTENELMPNYPNPFNPTTTIQYQLREQTHVMIEVYDVIGRRIQLLANETQLSGQHRVNFDGTNLSSGLYFIRFQAGDVVDIRKMTLIK